MPRIAANGIDIEYATHGSPNDPALLLVNGFTSQMTTGFDPVMAEMFAARGRYVIRYDNRDVGLSTHLDGHPAPVAALIAARKNKAELPPVAYKLSDMAADGMGLLSALAIDRAHILGCSMGGMIVQTMAIEHPSRVLSLTSVMSTTGESDFGQSTKEANTALLTPPANNRQDYIDQGVTMRRIWSSKRHFDAGREATRLGADWDRGIDPAGHARQLCAIISSGHRADALPSLDVPTLVIHGRDDTLIDPTGGLRTAELIPGSMLAYLSDMGHDLPRPQWPMLVDLVVGHQNRTTS